jgi:hypothetical protein
MIKDENNDQSNQEQRVIVNGMSDELPSSFSCKVDKEDGTKNCERKFDGVATYAIHGVGKIIKEGERGLESALGAAGFSLLLSG